MKDGHAKDLFIFFKITVDIKLFNFFFEVHVKNVCTGKLFWLLYLLLCILTRILDRNKNKHDQICRQDKILALQCNQVGQGIICQKSAYCYMSRFLCNR